MQPIGLNLAPVNYWSPCPYLDLTRASSSWRPQWAGTCVVGADGWPGSAGEFSALFPVATRSYTLIPIFGQFDNVRVIATGERFYPKDTSGRITFDAIAPAKGKGAQINVVTKGAAKFAIVEKANVDAYLAGQIWTDGFIARCAGSPCLRVMDWNQTNASSPEDGPLSDWPTRDSATLSSKRIPIADTADIVTRTGADIWWNVPTARPIEAAIEDIRQLRALVPPSTRIHVEWGNEVWNTAPGYRTGRYLIESTTTGGLGLKGSAVNAWYAARCAEFAKALEAASIPGVDFMLAWQFWGSVTGKQKVIDGYIAAGGPMSILDGLATAPYPYISPAQVEARRVAGDLNGMLDDLEASAKAAIPKAVETVALCRKYGLRATRYEEALSPFTQSDAQALFVMKALQLPRAGQIMRDLWKGLDAAGMDFGCFYTSAAQEPFGLAPNYDGEIYPQGAERETYNRRAWPMARADLRLQLDTLAIAAKAA